VHGQAARSGFDQRIDDRPVTPGTAALFFAGGAGRSHTACRARERPTIRGRPSKRPGSADDNVEKAYSTSSRLLRAESWFWREVVLQEGFSGRAKYQIRARYNENDRLNSRQKSYEMVLDICNEKVNLIVGDQKPLLKYLVFISRSLNTTRSGILKIDFQGCLGPSCPNI
jgi:hypothetical protein